MHPANQPPPPVDWLGPPTDLRPLLPVERAALLDLLAQLSPDEWELPTVCPGWQVRDIVAHLLHGQLRRLSHARDGHPAPPFAEGETLPAYLARANGEFVTTARQLSPRLLIDLIGHLGPQADASWSGLDLTAPAGVEVSWAAPGVDPPLWLHLAREYTEGWTHQQQIRDAADRPGADGPELLRPVLDTFLRALPTTLAPVPAPAGTTVTVTVPGPAGGHWTAVREPERWALRPTPDGPPTAQLHIPADVLWRLASRMTTPEEAARSIETEGDPALTDAVLRLVSIVR
ncbi:maleylpyruvate isomerase family mycothiol-dependent enzyme [Streptomyces sp. 3MP-14]|uniref:Maleylpyruvate isomerase family mycothiol-dependent enzyme n=1 Tax=Streptomyces mimosae TaxID=2586635 RepID=A0A5N6AEW2_9ACTN|nr:MULTISPECIES: maleylpyruvate isomerase N-terminal domain-containing protein [Streptomyces]KAB8166506.1 maleylpyruvate isomerase family mycothiol-dependent enzyme [Streptomyces mimosae]KAB8178935.1 maleylpyruvate isomerase family mycothiol-dependent enzyme [Streptomyces sp. 3MP-14]